MNRYSSKLLQTRCVQVRVRLSFSLQLVAAATAGPREWNRNLGGYELPRNFKFFSLGDSLGILYIL